MFQTIMSRIRQGHRTMAYPAAPPAIPERLRGYPVRTPVTSEAEITEADCPFGAYRAENDELDLGKCLFCAECTVPGVSFSTDYQLAVNQREQLMVRPESPHHYAQPLEQRLLSLLGRSLKFREVSAGGCNACEADTNVLSTIGWDLGRFGIQFVASPRHADGLWVTGPVTENMREALLMTYEAIPAPKIVVACGACAINGGPFINLPESHNGVDHLIPVDLYIPGCPPHPATMLDGLLRLLDKLR